MIDATTITIIESLTVSSRDGQVTRRNSLKESLKKAVPLRLFSVVLTDGLLDMFRMHLSTRFRDVQRAACT